MIDCIIIDISVIRKTNKPSLSIKTKMTYYLGNTSLFNTMERFLIELLLHKKYVYHRITFISIRIFLVYADENAYHKKSADKGIQIQTDNILLC